MKSVNVLNDYSITIIKVKKTLRGIATRADLINLNQRHQLKMVDKYDKYNKQTYNNNK